MIDYRALLALHLVAVALFVSGLSVTALMLPSLAARAASAQNEAEGRRVRRWNLFLTTPALLVLWVAGLTLAVEGGWLAAGWLHAKIVLVLALSALHGIQSARLRRLERGGGIPQRAPAWVAPAIVLLVAGIVLLAVAKP